MFFSSFVAGFWVDVSLGFYRGTNVLSRVTSPQLWTLVSALEVQSQRKLSSDYLPYSYESFIRHGFGHKEARLRSMLAGESKEVQRECFKTMFPSASEVTDSSLVKIVDVVRKHKKIDLPVTLFRCDELECSDLKKTTSVAAVMEGLTKFPAIILFPAWYQSNSSLRIHALYHELSHFMQTCRHPDSFLGCDRVEVERDADNKAFNDVRCCACLESIMENRSDACHEPQGYFGLTRIKAIIDQREAADQHGMCDGHKKMFSGKGATVELKDFIPNEAKRY